jgi:hypothetical protein
MQAVSSKWSHQELVFEQSPVPSAYRASLGVRNELFDASLFSSVPLSAWLSSVVLFLPAYNWVAPPPSLGQLSIPSCPHIGCFGGCNLPTSCTGLSGSLESRQWLTLTWQGCRFTQVELDQLQHSTAQACRSPRFYVHVL